MKYQDILDATEGEVIGDPISVEIKSWQNDGDYLIGRLKSIEPFSGGQFESQCNQYVFETDEGLISCIMGANMDRVMTAIDRIGKVLLIRYRGKIKLKDDRSCNKFSIYDVTQEYDAMLKTVEGTRNAKKEY